MGIHSWNTLQNLLSNLVFYAHVLWSQQCHVIMLHPAIVPDGLFVPMYGLLSGNRNDSFLVSNISLLSKIQEFISADASEDIASVKYSFHGSPGYPLSIHNLGRYKNPADGSAHAHWKSKMSKVGKWVFANILAQ